MTTNYTNTFIAVSPDTHATEGSAPKPGTVAAAMLEAMLERPYAMTSDELLFAVEAERKAIPDQMREAAWAAFAARPMACLRASALVKTYGWGLHHDENAKVAAYSMGTEAYRKYASDGDLKQVSGMRSRRA